MFERVQSVPRRRGNAWSRPLLGLLAAVGVLAACLAASGAAATKGASTPTFAQACGTAPITLQGYFESGFPDITDLTTAFTKQYPTAKWNVREDPFATITQDAPLDARRPEPSGPDAAADDRRSREGRRTEEPRPVLQRVSLEHVPGLAARAASDLDVGRGGR